MAVSEANIFILTSEILLLILIFSCYKTESPMNQLENMGIDVIEYVKLRIGYNFLKSNLEKLASEERKYTKAICPGLTSGIEGHYKS